MSHTDTHAPRPRRALPALVVSALAAAVVASPPPVAAAPTPLPTPLARLAATPVAPLAALRPRAAVLGGGGTIIYTKSLNLQAASPDGTHRRSLTHTGTAAHPVSQGSMADNGRWVFGVSQKLVLGFTPDGTGLVHGPSSLAPMDPGSFGSVGPLATTVNPAGSLIAYEYAALDGPPSYGTTWCTDVMAPGGPLHLRQWCGDWISPSWWGDKLVVSDTASLFLLNTMSSAGATGLLPFSGLGTVHWMSGSLSRSGTGLVAVGTAPNGSTTMSLAAYMPVSLVAGQPVPDWTSICFLPPDATGTASKAGFSPDGTAVVWADSRGVIEAPRPVGRDSNSICTFPAGWPALLAAGGTLPFWSKAGPPLPVATRLTGWPAKPVVARTGSGALKSTRLTLTVTPARSRTGTIQVRPCRTCAWKRYRSLKWPATATAKVSTLVTARKGKTAVYRLVLPATAAGKALTTRALTVVGR